MAIGSLSRRRRTLTLALAGGSALVLGCWNGGNSSEESQPPTSEPTAQGEADASFEMGALPEIRVDTGESRRAARRIGDGCSPAEEALRYKAFVGKRALATLSWTGLAEAAAGLEIPVFVVAVENGVIAARFLQFPMREEYLNVWLGSGHIQPGPEGQFLLDPCSATLEPWPYSARD